MIQVCSISPEPYSVRRNSYNFEFKIAPCTSGKEYTSATVEDQEDMKVIYHGLQEQDIEKIPFSVPSEVIVRDIFQSEDYEKKGLFVPRGPSPTDEELSTARARRTAWLVSAAEQGDRLFSQFGNSGIQHIPDFCKRAVRELRETRDWVFAPHAGKTECPVCGAQLNNLSSGKAPAICRECHSILDPERAAKHSTPVQTAPKRSYQRKSKTQAVQPSQP